jgi:hypothetical protein
MYDIVVIDDERTFQGNVDIYLRSSDEALLWLAKVAVNQYYNYGEPVQELWLDHDLGNGDDICIVVDFLMLLDFQIEKIWVHSQNPTVDWMVQVLRNKYNVSRSGLPTLKG